jgi:hypothetical protein
VPLYVFSIHSDCNNKPTEVQFEVTDIKYRIISALQTNTLQMSFFLIFDDLQNAPNTHSFVQMFSANPNYNLFRPSVGRTSECRADK